MNISKAQKKIIKDNYKELNLRELALKTDLSESTVSKYLKKFGKTAGSSKIEQTDSIISETQTFDLKALIKSNLDFFLLVAFLGVVIYFRNFFATFVSADDIKGFIQNPEILDFNYAYRTLLLHSIYYASVAKYIGFNAVLMHAVSLTFHIFITCCVYILTHILFNKKAATITALLFLVHPVNVETVSWISGVGYLLNGIFALPMLITYAIYKKTNNLKMFWISVLIYGAALLFIRLPWTITAFATLLVIDQFILEKKINFKSLLKLWPFFVATAMWALFYLTPGLTDRVTNLSSNFGLRPEDAEPLINRLPYTIYMMVRLYTLPFILSLFHEGIGISPLFYIFMILTTAAFFGWILFAWKKKRVYAGLTLCLVCSILPTLSPVQVAFFIAERYMYLGLASFCALLALVFLQLENKYKVKDLAKTLTIIFFLIYATRTFIRTNDWKNSKNLWLATSKVASTSARVYNNLGDAYANENNYQNSIQAFQTAIALQPNYADAIHNLGNTYLQAGQLDLAEQNLKQSFQLNPSLYQATYKLGIIAYQKKNLEEALFYFNKTLEIAPGNEEAIRAISIVQAELNKN